MRTTLTLAPPGTCCLPSLKQWTKLIHRSTLFFWVKQRLPVWSRESILHPSRRKVILQSNYARKHPWIPWAWLWHCTLASVEWCLVSFNIFNRWRLFLLIADLYLLYIYIHICLMPFTPFPSSDICWNCADYLSVIFLSHSRLGAMDHAAATELNIFCTEMYSTSADCLASVRAWALRNYLSPAISSDCLHRPFIQNRKRKWPSSLVFNLCQFGYAKVAIWIVWMENK